MMASRDDEVFGVPGVAAFTCQLDGGGLFLTRQGRSSASGHHPRLKSGLPARPT